MIENITSLEFQNVSFQTDFGSILNGINLSISTGDIVWIQGDVGRGLILKIAAGLVKPTMGRCLINGKSIYEMTFEEFLPFRKSIGYGFAFGGLINSLTIKENLQLYHQYHRTTNDDTQQTMKFMIELFQLQNYLNQYPIKVPGRVRKWTCLARTFIAQPSVILLDDPASAIGLPILNVLRNWIIEKQKSTCMLISSDGPELFNGLDYKKIYLKNGNIVSEEYHQQEVA